MNILLTGASRGIGAAAFEALTSSGHKVAGHSTRGGNGLIAGDLADPASTRKIWDAALEQLGGRIDALVNNAGIAIFKPLLETTPADWARTLAVNLTGAFLCTQAAVPLMREHGGSIVNITSISSLRASTLRVAYGTSKAALAHLTKQQAVELAALGIRVNAVRPGLIETDIHASGGLPNRVRDLQHQVPMQRGGTAEEVAEAIVWLLAPQSSYVTMSLLEVSGGR